MSGHIAAELIRDEPSRRHPVRTPESIRTTPTTLRQKAHTMATVEPYLLADGTRRYRVRYRTPENRSTDRRGFKTKREAQAFASTVEVSKLRGEYVAPSAGLVTIGSLAERWLSRGHLKATTTAARRSAWDHRVAPRWADVAIGEVKRSAVTNWVAELSAAGVSAPSIEVALLVLRGVLTDAVADRLIVANPAAGVKTPRRTHSQRGYLSHRQVAALCDQLNKTDSTLVAFLAYTGLRFGEAAALTVGDFAMLRHRVNITAAVAEVRGALVTSTPKTHEKRSVPFPAFLADELAALMVGRAPTDLVFVGATKKQLRISDFRPRVFIPAVRRCQTADPDFPTVTPHDLRHTAASLAISAGANVKAVQTMLGHASAAMTLDTYSDLFPDDLDAVAARLHEARAAIVGTVWARGC